jgi:hypothetical protein
LEKLQEAEHFLARLIESQGLEFQFELNAFLSACRSATFVMQKSLAHVPAFESWYRLRREEMKADAAMKFFIELRNISQKQGPVSYVGGSSPNGRWSYRFVSSPETVPPELVGRDIVDCCAGHLQKLAKLLQSYFRAYPFDACPAHAFSEEGMVALNYSFADAEKASGVPAGWTDIADIPDGEKLRLLRREIEPLDLPTLGRLADGDFRSDGTPLQIPKASGSDLVDDVAALLEATQENLPPSRELFISAIMGRIKDADGR